MDERPGGSAPRRKAHALLVVLCLVALATLTGLLAGQMKSPEQAAADARPPAVQAITARVERRVLTKTITFRGSVHAQGGVSLSVESAGRLVTRMATRSGAVVRGGDLIARLNDEPIFVLPGAVPMYRDLSEGMSGGDVQRLNVALRGSGLQAGSGEVFDAVTAAGVAQLFAAAGEQPPRSTSGGRSGRTHGPIVLPRSSIAWAPVLPATVVAINARTGQPAPSNLLTLATGKSEVSGAVPVFDAQLLRVGQRVQVESDDGAVSVKGTVVSLASPHMDQALGRAVTVTVKPNRSLPRSASRLDLRVVVSAASTRYAVWVVPEAALVGRGDGSVVVYLVRGHERTQMVVHPGLSSDGWVALRHADLRLTDQVIVGQAG